MSIHSFISRSKLLGDEVSFEMAKRMFPDIPVKCYPDIVTTLIGTKHFTSNRKGILLCCRDDSEKLYSESEISHLMGRLKEIDEVSMTDTTKHVVDVDDIDEMEKQIVRICTEKPFSKLDCLERAKSFDKNLKFCEYVELFNG